MDFENVPSVVQKAEIKQLTIQEIFRKVDGLKNAADSDKFRFDGGIKAINDLEKGLESIRLHYKKKLSEDEMLPADVAVSQAALELVAGSIRNLSLSYEARRQQVIGAVGMAGKVTEICQKIFDSEKNKAAAMFEALEQGDGGLDRPASRPIGQRPGPSVAAQRKAAEAEAEPEPETEAETKSVSPDKPKRRVKRVGKKAIKENGENS